MLLTDDGADGVKWVHLHIFKRKQMQLVYSQLTCIVYEEEMQIKRLFVMENFLLTSVHVQCNIRLGKRDHATDTYHEEY
jgi:hypothetical protein